MLAVQVELLTGRYVASRFNDRSRVEWPPHPARLFSAAVAAWADADAPDPAEREVLRWWESLGDPTISCSWGADQWSEREPVMHFVPDNDVQVVARDTSATYERLRRALGDDRALAKARTKAAADSTKVSSTGHAAATAIAVLPGQRGRQARHYPTAIPVSDSITYQWPNADARGPEVAVLDRLLARIPRLGHSSSFVAVSVVDIQPAVTLEPDGDGDVNLRVASPGQLDALEAAFAAHRGTEPRVLPARVAGYRSGTVPTGRKPSPVFGTRWILLDLGGPRATVRDTLAIARAVRGSLMRHGDQDPVPEFVSGHRPAPDGHHGPPTTRPHLAVVPLPFAAHERADGLVRVVALVLPESSDDDARATIERATRKWLDAGGALHLGARGSVALGRLDVADAPRSAQPHWWCRASRRWATVTPIALDRNPGDLRAADAGRRARAEDEAIEVITDACSHISLPPPSSVAIQTDPLVRGSAPVRAFPRFEVQGGRVRRLLVHASLNFSEPVSGPMLLGAGRFLGYGLCAPLESGSVDA